MSTLNYWVAMVLLLAGLVIVMDSKNLIKKLVGLGIFQSAVFLFYITMGKVSGGAAPILDASLKGDVRVFSNPLPHVLILTAIVVGVATTAVGLALVLRIQRVYGSVDETAIEDTPEPIDEVWRQ